MRKWTGWYPRIGNEVMVSQVLLWDLSNHEEWLKSSAKSQHELNNAFTELTTQEKSQEIPFCRFACSSAIESGHRSVITDVQWLPRNMEVNYQGDLTTVEEPFPNQFLSTSLDGLVNFWDIRFKKDYKSVDLMWKPFFRVPLLTQDGTIEFGLTRIALNQSVSVEPAKSMNGTIFWEEKQTTML